MGGGLWWKEEKGLLLRAGQWLREGLTEEGGGVVVAAVEAPEKPHPVSGSCSLSLSLAGWTEIFPQVLGARGGVVRQSVAGVSTRFFVFFN